VYLQKDGNAMDLFDVVTSESDSDDKTVFVFLRLHNSSLSDLQHQYHVDDTFTFHVSFPLPLIYMYM